VDYFGAVAFLERFTIFCV